MISEPVQKRDEVRGLWRSALAARREMFWVVLGQAAGALGGIVGVRLLTHVLPPAAYGQLALGLTITTLIQQALLSPLAVSSLRFFSAAREAGEIGPFIAALKSLARSAIVIVLALAVIAIAAVAVKNLPAWIPIISWCALFSVLSNFSAVLDGMQNAARQRAIVAWHDGASVWLRFLIGTAVVLLFGQYASCALAGYSFAALLVLGSQYYFFHRVLVRDGADVRSNADVRRWKTLIVDYGLPFASWGVFVWVQSSSERWALQFFANTVQVAQYAVLFQLGYYPIMTLHGVVMRLILPIIFRHAGDGTDQERLARCRRWTLRLVLGTLGVTALAALAANALSPFIFRALVPASYSPAAPFLKWIVLSSGVLAAGEAAGLALQTDLATGSLRKPKIASALVAVALNMLGARLFGLVGVVAAGLAFSMLQTTWISTIAFGLAGRRGRHA